jgi:biopolymer transport protein ExbD
MARREGEEINAGSMADIAFLLLIFFIVTTTMDLEAGISKTLPIKTDIVDPNPPEVKMRDVFSIAVNNADQLYVENEIHVIEDLHDMLFDYFTANMYSETDDKMARYVDYDVEICKLEIKKLKLELETSPEDLFLQSKLIKWEKRLGVCEAMPTGAYREMHETAVIQVKQKSKSSYGNFVNLLTEITAVINEVRDIRCKELFNGMSYNDLDLEIDADQEKERILRVLVPEKVIEPPIIN